VTQVLGQLERVGADAALVPTRVPAPAGQITSRDGPMIAYGRRVARHQGTITRRGRIMAGAPAVMAHHAAGYAVCVASQPPAIHRAQLVVASGHTVVEATGSALVVIARAVNALAVAVACAKPAWGLRCRLEDPEPHGLASVEATAEGPVDDGRQVDRGSWKAPTDDDAPRLVVLVVPTEGQT